MSTASRCLSRADTILNFLTFLIQDVDFPVKEIRLEVNCSVADTWVEIDAVQMSGQKQSSGQ